MFYRNIETCLWSCFFHKLRYTCTIFSSNKMFNPLVSSSLQTFTKFLSTGTLQDTAYNWTLTNKDIYTANSLCLHREKHSFCLLCLYPGYFHGWIIAVCFVANGISNVQLGNMAALRRPFCLPHLAVHGQKLSADNFNNWIQIQHG